MTTTLVVISHLQSPISIIQNPPPPSFDAHADSYDEDLQQALSVSGEDKLYFAEGRIRWLADWLSRNQKPQAQVLDFGCGTGTAVPFIRKHLQPQQILGVDVSLKSLDVARTSHGGSDARFKAIGSVEKESFDVAYCNGVFHHIPLDARQQSLAYVFDALKPGGIFALFENNPWNPATRYVMSRCSFDHDAITLAPTETRKRMRQAGFRILTTRFHFIFPSLLKFLRPLEAPLSPLPLGTQYVVIGVKP